MKKAAIIILSLSALLLGSNVRGEEKKAEPQPQTTCPVMKGQPIEKDLFIDVKGKRVYVCCKGCIAQVRGNPDKYIKRLEDQGVVFKKAPDSKKETQK